LQSFSSIVYVTGGVTVDDTGLVITDGGLSVKGGGLAVLTGGLQVAGGSSVVGGAVISGGATIYGNMLVFSTVRTFISCECRLKRDIVPIADALEKVQKLNGVYFNWIQDEPNGIKFDEKRHVGIIAQEVLAVLPEVVSDIHEGKYLGVDYASMMPLLIEAVRELDDMYRDGTFTA
jgi:hypothetical protein